jgi:hypothetical protein
MGPLANEALCLRTIVNLALALSVRYKFPDFRRQYNLAVTIQLQRKYAESDDRQQKPKTKIMLTYKIKQF